jgi:hypothetical protein
LSSLTHPNAFSAHKGTGQEAKMNTCRLNLRGFGVDVAPGANRTLRVNSGTWELEDSFQLVTLRGNCFYGRHVGLDVSSMIFCPPRVNPSSQSDVTFLLWQFSMLPARPAKRRPS